MGTDICFSINGFVKIQAKLWFQKLLKLPLLIKRYGTDPEANPQGV
jgi:hypothetical protein